MAMLILATTMKQIIIFKIRMIIIIKLSRMIIMKMIMIKIIVITIIKLKVSEKSVIVVENYINYQPKEKRNMIIFSLLAFNKIKQMDSIMLKAISLKRKVQSCRREVLFKKERAAQS